MATKLNFNTDRPYLFTISPWKELGYAVPAFGDNHATINHPIWALADEIGKTQLFLMAHVDARRTQPPSPNTVLRIGKLLNRVQSVLASRQKEYKDIRLEEAHASPVAIPWQIHPVPYFNSGVVRNRWLSEYNKLLMIALTNIYQHSDNNLALTVTEKFATDIYQYFREIKHCLGVELLLLSQEEVQADNFLFTEEQVTEGYDPNKVIINYEGMDTPGPLEATATEDDYRPLFQGYPTPLIIPHLAEYVVNEDGLGAQGQSLRDIHTAPGTVDNSGVGTKLPGTVGQPTI